MSGVVVPAAPTVPGAATGIRRPARSRVAGSCRIEPLRTRASRRTNAPSRSSHGYAARAQPGSASRHGRARLRRSPTLMVGGDVEPTEVRRPDGQVADHSVRGCRHPDLARRGDHCSKHGARLVEREALLEVDERVRPLAGRVPDPDHRLQVLVRHGADTEGHNAGRGLPSAGEASPAAVLTRRTPRPPCDGR